MPVTTQVQTYTFRSGFLYDLTDSTSTFTSTVKVRTIQEIPFIGLPDWMQDYVTAEAALQTQIWLKADAGDIAIATQLRDQMYVAAKRAERMLRDTRLTSTIESRRIRGFRETGGFIGQSRAFVGA